ncbi:hypothetical protein GmHk_15G045104 [Glycine max]|nr:hypothetical protein GmHk_15G045104 [Glycine max]
MKIGDKIFDLLNGFVEEIEEKNMIQVVMDNGSNYKLASKILEVTRPKIFWTPCVAHCLDLILEDIGRIPTVKRVIQRDIQLVCYIYNHTLTLNTMRKFTNKTELVRTRVTRFATTFLSLQRLHKQKVNLRRMFTSEEWRKLKATKEAKGKKATNVVLLASFWSHVVFTLKAIMTLVSVLRIYYTNPNIDKNVEVEDGLYKCIAKISEDDEFEVAIHKELLRGVETGLI